MTTPSLPYVVERCRGDGYEENGEGFMEWREDCKNLP
jgi:hypothetical protein